MTHCFGAVDELGEGLRLPQGAGGPLGVRRLRRQRDRLPPQLRGLSPLPRRAGRALLRPRRHRAVRGRRRGAARAGWALPRRVDDSSAGLERGGRTTSCCSSSAARADTSSATVTWSTRKRTGARTSFGKAWPLRGRGRERWPATACSTPLACRGRTASRATRASSRSRNQIIMSTFGLAASFVPGLLHVERLLLRRTPKSVSGGFVW